MQIRVKRKKVSKIVSRFSFLQELFLRKFFDTCNASRSLFPSPRSCRKWQICEGREKRRGKGRKAGRRQTFSYFFFYFLWTTQYGPRYTSFQIATDRHKFFFSTDSKPIDRSKEVQVCKDWSNISLKQSLRLNSFWKLWKISLHRTSGHDWESVGTTPIPRSRPSPSTIIIHQSE